MKILSHNRSVLQIVPELRNYHLDLLDDNVDQLLYFQAKYDLESVGSDGRVKMVTWPEAAKIAMTTRASVLDIWEPLWVRNLPFWLITVYAFRIGHILRHTRIVSYCMENNDIDSLLFGVRASTVPALIKNASRIAFKCFIRCMVLATYDRLAFASEGSRSTYLSLSRNLVENKVFTSLPKRPPTLPNLVRSGVIFVGRLEHRKGIQHLLQAWEHVEAVTTGHLTIVGNGPLAEETREWASAAESRAFLGELDNSVVRQHLQHHKVLVLPSVREGRWREQIGLPILEGLAAGCVIVTSDETGLAHWLEVNGHYVYSTSDWEKNLPQAIIGALENAYSVEDGIRLLPSESTRRTAMNWMRRS